MLLGLWLLLRALRRQRILAFAWAGVVLALSILMRFGAIPSVGILLLLPLAAERRGKAFLACLAGLVAGLAPYLLWSRLEFGGFFSTLRAGWAGIDGPTESSLYFLRNSGTIFTPVAIGGFLLIAACLAWRLLRAVPSLRRSDLRLLSRFSLPGFYVYLFFWLLAGFLFFSSMPHKEPRYILPLAPPFLLLAGSGLAQLCTLPARPLRIAGSVLVSASLAFTFLPLRERLSGPFIDPTIPEEEIASQFLESNLPSQTVLYMNFNYPAFAIYTAFGIHELPYGPDVYPEMNKIPKGDVLIVYREAEDPTETDIPWVDRNPKFQRIREFKSFVIFQSLSDQPSLAKSAGKSGIE
jgi:hypothetical protein